FEFSQDKAFLQKCQKQIADITYTIVYLRDENGLTSAIPNSDAKYLMDNCEVYSGLQAVMRLATSLEWKEKDLYTNIARTQKSSILSLYFNQVKQNFYWALDEAGFHNSDWNIFYPDALAQLFPIAFGLLDDRPELKKQLWEKFNALYEIKYNYPPEQQIIIKLAEKRMKL
ncbi:MAG TPA: hypothetical protein PLD62_11035, partial [Candidatus Cloacimonadota bacterium]|nr:hypothetical protein [Candidatus Cloacimonadota bacterium]